MSAAGDRADAPPDEPADELIPADELARLRRIEQAARELLHRSQGRRSASEVLSAMAALRLALRETSGSRTDEDPR